MKRPVQLPLFAEETVSVKWAAEYLGVSEVTVLRYREEGLLRGYQMAHRGWWRLMKDSVVEYEERIRRKFEIPQRHA